MPCTCVVASLVAPLRLGRINKLKTRVTGAAASGAAFYDDPVAEHLSDAELTDLAMASTPSDPFADDAVPFGQESMGAELLPEWYMPAPRMSAADRTPRRVFTVGLIVVAMLLLNGAGLCVTYGLPEIAW